MYRKQLNADFVFKDHSLIRFVAVAILEECCMSTADMQWLIHTGERVDVHGPFVRLRMLQFIS